MPSPRRDEHVSRTGVERREGQDGPSLRVSSRLHGKAGGDDRAQIALGLDELELFIATLPFDEGCDRQQNRQGFVAELFKNGFRGKQLPELTAAR